MEYEESERSGYQDREDEQFAGDIHIRQEMRGIIMYAVFDGEEQVSEDFPPPQDEDLLWFVRGYSKGVERYS